MDCESCGKQCTGCGACINTCLNKCIKLTAREDGFWYPVIDKNKCLRCEMCAKVCPVLTSCYLEDETQKAYAVQADDIELRKCSSSGGVFSLLAEEILAVGGVVYGATFDEALQIKHIRVNEEAELHKLRGSKYVQSDIVHCYIPVKDDLQSGLWVLFSGTPCQIQGLKATLGQEYERLLCVDFVCLGVSPPELWQRYLEWQRKTFGKKVVSVTFRDKRKSWQSPMISLRLQDGKEIVRKHNKDRFMQLYSQKLILRESCYSCPFRALDRISDLTLGDFWGINRVSPDMNDELGTSLVIVHSEKGREVFDNIIKKSKQKEVDVHQVIPLNPAISLSIVKPNRREQFFKDIQNEDFSGVSKRYVRGDWWWRNINRIAQRIRRRF